MSIWGKLIGGTVGFLAMGGPIGALMGIAAGHLLDQTVRGRGSARWLRDGTAGRPGPEQLQLAFTVAVIALAAKLAKADGQVTRDEVAAFKRVINVPDIASEQIGRIFDEARQSADGYEAYARQIADLLRDNRAMREELLGALLMIAHVDGVYHAAERAYIADVGRIFGFSQEEIRRIEGTFGPAGPAGHEDPYEILGIGKNATDGEVKSAYRKLSREYHPDTLIAQGLPEEFIEVANRKMAEINAAHDRIRTQRGLT